jgi:hypothetical protein
MSGTKERTPKKYCQKEATFIARHVINPCDILWKESEAFDLHRPKASRPSIHYPLPSPSRNKKKKREISLLYLFLPSSPIQTKTSPFLNPDSNHFPFERISLLPWRPRMKRLLVQHSHLTLRYNNLVLLFNSSISFPHSFFSNFFFFFR